MMHVTVARDFVQLTEAERRIAKWVGEQRYDYALRTGRNPGNGPSRHNGGPHFHIRGACSEFAASIMLNLYWRPAIGQLDQRDVGGIVEVRSTELPHGRLLIKPGDTGPHMLVVQINEHEYQSPGWLNAEDAQLLPLVQFGDAVHCVGQAALRPLKELAAMCHHSAQARWDGHI